MCPSLKQILTRCKNVPASTAQKNLSGTLTTSPGSTLTA